MGDDSFKPITLDAWSVFLDFIVERERQYREMIEITGVAWITDVMRGETTGGENTRNYLEREHPFHTKYVVNEKLMERLRPSPEEIDRMNCEFDSTHPKGQDGKPYSAFEHRGKCPSTNFWVRQPCNCDVHERNGKKPKPTRAEMALFGHEMHNRFEAECDSEGRGRTTKDVCECTLCGQTYEQIIAPSTPLTCEPDRRWQEYKASKHEHVKVPMQTDVGVPDQTYRKERLTLARAMRIDLAPEMVEERMGGVRLVRG